MKMMKDYGDLYLKCNVLLSADVFEKFRNNSFKNHGLCPSHYFSAPALSWDALLNMTKVELELIPDPDIYIFFGKGIRDGVSCISNGYSKAINKCFKSYDPKQESKHIIYLGGNNLYVHAMSKFLPARGLKWIDPKEFDLNKYTSNSSKGCALEANPECPKEFRESHNGYPLASDKIEIKREILSDYQLKIADLYNIPIGNVKNLVHNVFDKENYVIHYEELQLYLRFGLNLRTYITY